MLGMWQSTVQSVCGLSECLEERVSVPAMVASPIFEVPPVPEVPSWVQDFLQLLGVCCRLG
jgi:hypothetical protein